MNRAHELGLVNQNFTAKLRTQAAFLYEPLTRAQSSQTTSRAFEIASTDEKNVSLLYLTNDPAQKIIEIETSQSKLHNAV